MASKGANQPAESSAEQALATIDHSKGMVSASEMALVGGESSDFGRQDLSVPFLRILQGLSPYVTKGDEKYTKEADTGMIVETVTPRFFDGEHRGLIIIPVMYQRSYTEWAPKRGGLVQDHGSDPTILSQCKTEIDSEGRKRLITPAGNELAEGAQYYVFYGLPPLPDQVEPIEFEQAILVLAGTQWKQARDWNTNMSRVKLIGPGGQQVKNPLPFAAAYHFTTAVQQKGENKFFGWKIKHHCNTLELPNGMELIQAAADFRKLALSGAVKGHDDGIGGDGSAVDGDKIPF